MYDGGNYLNSIHDGGRTTKNVPQMRNVINLLSEILMASYGMRLLVANESKSSEIAACLLFVVAISPMVRAYTDTLSHRGKIPIFVGSCRHHKTKKIANPSK